MLSPTAVSLPSSPVASASSTVVSAAHCVFCFDCVLQACEMDVPLPLAEVGSRERFPLFITWKKRPHPQTSTASLAAAAARSVSSLFSSSPSPFSSASPAPPPPLSAYRLRGCIGTFSPKLLSSGLREYAVTSAFHDHRFSPITASEVPYLHVSVSLLTDFTPLTVWDDWEVGVHGITISYRHINATYLPEVALEQGWTKEETVEELMRKGGWEGRVGERERREMKVTRYESQKRGMGWEEYQMWKEQQKKAQAAALTTAPRANGWKAGNGKRNRKVEDEEDHNNGEEDGEDVEDDGQ